ncbi:MULTISPECIES: hypothetical protein [Rhizobium]|jgi:hypothetical protein|uniref:HARP domain-containing protein n=1 Tax=Rhizobium leguminosarum bv. trifolii (strain WSM1325) TaxID=395491 RepID=C6AVI4_RHILS|nr:hypothetical protein [Rhizobium leguminosarum]ACS55795.1 conserved hypothetical protein [Rhizobium leguminosarum bv. trifolii WSM1325]MBY2941231.1 hypothetical protein [Rhizobium leguminosarum]MBY2995719.1 hypothetical protein [Rhizobium leguminosarum]MBY3023193.1 hypothetical protein [Rhizobium leguminosarum]MBY3046698.1 hypothetical protein [Rhizobium leguminosarum]
MTERKSAADHDEAPSDEDDAKPGADISFPYDRMTVEQFRSRFPRARWSDARKAWFVPGRTASRRIGRWLAEIEAEADAHADAKGRDAFVFDPIDSPYLELGKAGFRIRTPYSKTVVDELREVPFSRWDGDLRIWHVPFRSYEELRRRWSDIEAAARRNEPEERRRRAEERKGTEQDIRSKLRSAERKRHRYPLRSDDLPPIGRPVVIAYGIVVFTEISGELVDPDVVVDVYPGITEDHVWGYWRPPTFEELVRTWPAKMLPIQNAEWWLPTIEELRPARRTARSREARKYAKTP